MRQIAATITVLAALSLILPFQSYGQEMDKVARTPKTSGVSQLFSVGNFVITPANGETFMVETKTGRTWKLMHPPAPSTPYWREMGRQDYENAVTTLQGNAFLADEQNIQMHPHDSPAGGKK